MLKPECFFYVINFHYFVLATNIIFWIHILTFTYSVASVSITQLYSHLSKKVGRESAENLSGYIEDKIKNELAEKLIY